MLAATRGLEGVDPGVGAVSLAGSAIVALVTVLVAVASVGLSLELLHVTAIRPRITRHRARFRRTMAVEHI